MKKPLMKAPVLATAKDDVDELETVIFLPFIPFIVPSLYPVINPA